MHKTAEALGEDDADRDEASTISEGSECSLGIQLEQDLSDFEASTSDCERFGYFLVTEEYEDGNSSSTLLVYRILQWHPWNFD